MRRRFVAGLREVAKQAARGRLKALFVAPDAELIESKGRSTSLSLYHQHVAFF